MGRAIGIDLGTTFSCIACLEGSQPQIIPNKEGLSTTPSVVSFTSSGEILVGNLALRQAVTNPENTIYAVKRLIGKKFNSEEIRKAQQRMAYQIGEAANGDVTVLIESKKISPQEISAMILSYLKESAEEHYGEKIDDAIITVPAHFDDTQRQATKDAARIAGLNVLRVINEPTAASLSHGLVDKKNAKIAIYDMGGGTFDITVLEVYDGVFNVLATNGNTYLGGEDFDNRILDWLLEEFKKNTNIDLSQDKFALQRIKEASEKAKRELSFSTETEINLPFVSSEPGGAKHLREKLTREKLEELTDDLVKESIPYVRQALQDAKLEPRDIEETILVGGQAQMPLIGKVIAEFFGKEPVKSPNPDEVVAAGAAIQSGIIMGEMKDIVLLDVTPLSLGIEAEHNNFVKIIERNTTIPTKKSIPFTTVEHNQSTVRIHVLQGEREVAAENRSLGMFDLVGIEPAPAGLPQIDVAFEIDADGITKVSARDTGTGKEQKIEVNPSSGLSEEEIERIIEEAEKYERVDRQRIQAEQTRAEIKTLINSLETYFYRDEEKVSFLHQEDIRKILAKKKEILETEDLEKLEISKKEINKLVDLISTVSESTESLTPEEGKDE
jgi:molecular chaperone DnaK